MEKKKTQKQIREEQKAADLRRRVLDILNGAGLVWQDDDTYFEAMDGTQLEATGRAIEAIERAFDLGESRFRKPWQLKRLDELNGFIGVLNECLKYDKPQ